MKFAYILLGVFLTSFAVGQETEEKEIPAPSEPPYEVGALPLESGYTIKREGAPDINFRFVDNKMRLYWLDEDGLVMEPEFEAATVRFTRVLRGRDFHRVKLLSDEAALGTTYNVPPPHIYRVVLVLDGSNGEEGETFYFNYSLDMDKVAVPDS